MKSMLATVLIVSTSILAQSGSIAGKWDVTADAAKKKTDDGGSVSRNAQRYVLDLNLDGTKATATLTPTGGPGKPWNLSGTWQQSRLELSSAWRDIPITKDGKPETAKARYLVRMTESGGALAGTCEFAMENSEPMPQPCKAVRAK